MDEFDTIQEFEDFQYLIIKALKAYCLYRYDYSQEVVLGINPISLSVAIDKPRNLVGYEIYPIDNYIAEGQPDVIAINELVKRYIFVG